MKYLDIGDFGDAYSRDDVTTHYEFFEADVFIYD